MCLTAHQRLAFLRRFPEARIEVNEEFFGVIVVFPNDDSVWVMPDAHSGPGYVLPMSAAGYAAMAEPLSDEATAAEAMLREFLGCP